MAENNEFYRLNLVLRMEDRISNSLRNVDRQVRQLERAFQRARAASSRLGNTNVKAVVHIDTTRIESALNRIINRLDTLNGRRVSPTVIVNDQSTHTINNINQNLRRTTGRKWDIVLGIRDGVTNRLNGIKETLLSPMGMLGMGMATMGAGAITSDVIGTYKDFEHQMKAVQAISGATGAEFDSLTEKAREMGATTAFSATEAGKAFEYMAMAGWKPEQMEAAIKPMLNLAAAGGTDLGLTSDIVTDAMTAFKMDATAENVQMFTDVVAKAATSANTDVAKMGYTFQYLATSAGSLGYSIQDTALAIELVADMGIKGEKAGTGLLAMINGLSSPTNEAAAAMQKLGISIDDGTGKAKPFRQTMTELRNAFKTLSPLEQQQLANTIAGVDGMKTMLAMVGATDERFKEFADGLDHASDSIEENGLTFQGWAEKVAATRMDSLEGDLKILGSAWQDFQIGLLSGGGGDFLREFVQGATQTIGEFGKILKDPEFQKLEWGDKIIFLLDQVIAKIDAWASGSGGEQLGKVLTKLAEIGIRAFIAALTGLVGAAFKALSEGNIAAAAGLGLGAALMPGVSTVVGGATHAVGSYFVTPGAGGTGGNGGGNGGEGGGNTGGRVNWGRLGTAAKWAGRIAKPVQAAIDVNRLYESDDKLKTGSEVAGGWAGMIAGAKVGAAAGGTLGATVGGVGAAPGALIGGLAGGIGGYVGGSALGGGIVDSVRDAATITQEVFASIKEQAEGAVESIATGFQSIPEHISEFVSEAGDVLSTLPEEIAYGIGETIASVCATLAELPPQASVYFSDLVTQASAYVSALPGEVAAWMSQTAAMAESYAAEVITGVISWFEQLPGLAGDKMSAMYNAVSAWAGNIVSSISSWFSQIPSIVSSYFDNAISAIQNKVASVKASFSMGFSAGGIGHADGGIFSQEHVARFAEGNKPEAIIPLDISKRSRGLSILGQVQDIFGVSNDADTNDNETFIQNLTASVLSQAREMIAQSAALFEDAGGHPALTPVITAATGNSGGSDGGTGGSNPSFSFSGINFNFGSDIDEESLAVSIGRRFLAEIRQGNENRG